MFTIYKSFVRRRRTLDAKAQLEATHSSCNVKFEALGHGVAFKHIFRDLFMCVIGEIHQDILFEPRPLPCVGHFYIIQEEMPSRK